MKYLKRPCTIGWIICLILFIGLGLIPNKYNTMRPEECVVMDKLQMGNGIQSNPMTLLCLALKNDKGEICVVNVGEINYVSTKVGQHVNYMLSDEDFKRGDSWHNVIFNDVTPVILFFGFFVLLFLSFFDDYDSKPYDNTLLEKVKHDFYEIKNDLKN